MTPGIEFRNVSKHYAGARGAAAVRDISFALTKGTLTSILGPSGCGKTTTLRMIAGLETPTAGRIFIDGQDVTTLGPAQRNASMVFQSYALFPHMSVLENVMYGPRMSGVPAHEARASAGEALRSVGLVGFDERLPSELSGGQQQRVALARALVLEPAVLLFDEPLSNLDARLRRDMREEIRSLQQRLALTVVYVTHDRSEALAVSDEIIVMDHGTIAQRGAPRVLYEQPANEFVASFMGEATLFDAQLDGQDMVQLGPLRIAARNAASARAVKVAIRPEAWRIGPAGSGLHGRVVKFAYLGSHLEYTFDTAIGPVFAVSSELGRALGPGDEAGLEVALESVWVVDAQAPSPAAGD